MLISIITILKIDNYFLFEKLYNTIKNQINIDNIEWILIEQNNNINSFYYKSLIKNIKLIYIHFDNCYNDDDELRNKANYSANGEYILFMNYNFYYELDYIYHNINKLIKYNKLIGSRSKIGIFNFFNKKISFVNLTKYDLLYDTLIYNNDYIKNNFFNKDTNFINNNLLELDNNILFINNNLNDENIDFFEISEEFNNKLNSYINNNVELIDDLESDIIYYMGPDVKFDPTQFNMNLNIQSVIEMSEKWAHLCNKVIVYANFDNEIIHNNVKYVKWYKLKNVKNIIISDDGIESILNYKLFNNNIIIIDLYNNFKFKNSITTYFNLFDKVNNFIFYNIKYFNNFIKLIDNRYNNIKIIYNPLHYERLFNNNLINYKNPDRYYIYNNNLLDCLNNLKLFVNLYKLLNNINIELHIYNNEIVLDKNNNNYIHIHNNFNIQDIINEQQKSSFHFNIYYSDYIDTYNLINCINFDCIPINQDTLNNYNNNNEILNNSNEIFDNNNEILNNNNEIFDNNNEIFDNNNEIFDNNNEILDNKQNKIINKIYNIIINKNYLNNYKIRLLNTYKTISWLTKSLDILNLININYSYYDLKIYNDKIFTKTLNHIKEPEEKLKIWATPYNGQKLSVVIIEPRKHENLKGVIYQMANIYGNSDVSLYIFHGTNNYNYLNNIFNSWTNILFINLNIDNLLYDDYNKLLTNYKFWEIFKSEFVLIFQLDSIILKKIPDIFFNYHYIGAPWINNPFIKNNIHFYNKKIVGNGGFSLRNVKVMIDICKNCKNVDNDNEDVFFSMNIDDNFIPDEKLAEQFSIESKYYHDPVGMHNVWNYIENHNYIKLFNKIVNIYN